MVHQEIVTQYHLNRLAVQPLVSQIDVGEVQQSHSFITIQPKTPDTEIWDIGCNSMLS